MKRSFSVLLLAGLCTLPALAAEPSPACAAKRASIEAQIEQAKAHGNRRELAGLNRALRANQAGCTDASLEAERQRDIAAASKKVSQREADLAKAQAKGDAEKIAKRQAKLDEAQAELKKAQAPILP